ncbi:ParB-like nuclease family protein [Paraburkholderia sp. BL23I1N1]|uniref:ParB N-terminal domain-containing protein n=1 Tax=Paraburkholderia sp. BL23I1N1 TaxID=1938802 RepID=UPI000E7625D1|nr:ParB N-terminal domain-containing protein [Paraburkholderia sp. BL23I1N1]RKE37567.1 ParB-like nuclease family protein [Paraburkholderia sp. BL23I1N1]
MLDKLPYCVALKPLAFFRPSEAVDEHDVHRLAAAIREAGSWTTPIPIEKGTGIIMDGNHRARAAALLGLRYVPCVLLDYRDPRVSVTHWQTGEPFCIDSIRRRILQDKALLPYKTTRHRFAPVLPATEILLSVLHAGA